MSVQSYLCAILALITSLVFSVGLRQTHPVRPRLRPRRSSRSGATRRRARRLPVQPRTTMSPTNLKPTWTPLSLDGAVYHGTYLEISATGTHQAYPRIHFLLECSLTTFECETVEGGFGMVSADDLTTSRDRITVNTNTAENPTFELWEGSGGQINVTWTQLSGWSSRYTIHSRYVQASYSSHSHGTFDTGPALAEGTVVGVQLPPGSGYASMGSVKEGGIFIERQR